MKTTSRLPFHQLLYDELSQQLKIKICQTDLTAVGGFSKLWLAKLQSTTCPNNRLRGVQRLNGRWYEAISGPTLAARDRDREWMKRNRMKENDLKNFIKKMRKWEQTLPPSRKIFLFISHEISSKQFHLAWRWHEKTDILHVKHLVCC